MIEKKSVEEFYGGIDSFLLSAEFKTWYTIIDEVRVSYGYKKDCDLDWCIKNEIPAVNMKRGGGCIVSAPGNIHLIDIREFDGHTWLAHDILKEFTKFLIGRGLDVRFDHNDIMVEGYKVASGVSINLRPSYKMQYTGLQFSVNQDLEVIEHVCLKEMKKQPRGLSDFGVTTKDIESWILKVNY